MVDIIIKIVSVLIGFITLLIALLKIYKHIIEREQKQQDMFERVFDELAGVKKRLDTHNHYAEKIGTIEKSIVRIDTSLSLLNKEKD